MDTTNPSTVTDSFKEAFHHRCLQSLFRILVFQPVCIFGATLLLNLVFPEPLKWLDSFCIIGSLTNWLYIILLLICIIAITAFHVQKYSVQHEITITKWDAVWRLIRPTHILGVVFLLVIGAISVRCYLGLVNDQRSNLISVSRNIYCLNEMHTFIVLHGAYAGIVYGLTYFLFSRNEITFPDVQVKQLQLQLSMLKMFFSSCKTVLTNLKWFYILYYFLGHHPRTLIMSLLKVEQCCSLRKIDSISGVLDFSLFWTTWLSAATLYFTWDICIHIFQYYITKPYFFPIVPSTSHADDTIYLHQALVANVPLLRYLGYLDLSLLSLNSPDRRKEIFTLTQPGGHPYNWQSLSNECICILDTFTTDLNLSGNTDPVPEITKPEYRLVNTSVQPKCTHGITSPQVEAENVYAMKSQCRVTPASVIKLWCQNKSVKFVNAAKNWCTNLHLLRKRKTSAQVLFANSQTHIWAVQALSFLAYYSYREDRFGVVQQDLADIIVVFCKLLQALEKKQKGISRVPKIVPSYWDNKGFKKLLMETKLAVNRIAVLFHSHLDGLNLSAEYTRLINQFANCE